ncbi:hypothetical protein ACQJBY_068098 [Aegilops geniculata]
MIPHQSPRSHDPPPTIPRAATGPGPGLRRPAPDPASAGGTLRLNASPDPRSPTRRREPAPPRAAPPSTGVARSSSLVYMDDGAKLGLLGDGTALFTVFGMRNIQSSLVKEMDRVFEVAAADVGICWTNGIMYRPLTCSHSTMNCSCALMRSTEKAKSVGLSLKKYGS